MFDKLSERAYQGHTPQSKRGLLGEWIVSIAAAAYAIYLFNSGTIDGPISPVLTVTTAFISAILGYTVAAKSLQSNRFREIWSNNIYRFGIILIFTTTGVVIALLSTVLFGYLVAGIVGVTTGGAVARTILYVRGAQPS